MQPPFVRNLPYRSDALSYSRASLWPSDEARMCVNHHKWWVLRSCLSHSFLRSSRSPRFSPPHCYQCFSGLGSSVHPCESVALFSLSASGSPSHSSFITPISSSRCQIGRASLGKVYCLPIYRPAAQRFVFCSAVLGFCLDIGTRLLTSARSTPLYHIAGSLFATYTGTISCFLPTRHYCRSSCLVDVALPSRTVSSV